MKNIAIFASGSGTNTEKIIEYFNNHKGIKVAIVLSNKPDAYVIQRTISYNIPYAIFNKEQFYKTNEILNILLDNKINLVVLAGFLWLVPDNILLTYSDKVINIHPALLPKYGGKGMYGNNVHKAVINNKEKETGITIHYVNKNYDEGAIIFQAKCNIDLSDNSESIADKVHELEHYYYPRIIEDLIM